MVRVALPARWLVVAALLSACSGDPGDTDAEPDAPELAAEVVQLRRDEVLERVEVALENTGPETVVVESLRLRVPGFRAAGAVPKDSPVPPGQVVNLPTPYGGVRCPGSGEPRIGRPVVTVRVHTAPESRSRRVSIDAGDGGLLTRIARAECTARRLAREVDVRFGSRWRLEKVGGDVVVHGTLEARLLADQPRDLTQVAGTVIYALRADAAGGQALASLTPARPRASVPVTVSVASCSGHARGETKKPYAFLVWVGPPGGEQLAVNPGVDAASRAAFRRVCPL